MPRKKSTTTKTKKDGPTIDVFDRDGKIVGKMDLPKEIFGTLVNNKLLAQAVRVYLANNRQGTVSTKTRGEVAGSTRKIYRQKGTGRARHGSIKAPIFVGGGITFGPKPRDFSLKLPQKMKHRALLNALTSKFNDKEILVIDNFKNLKAKTVEMVKIFKNLKIKMDNNKLTSPTLLITTKDPQNLYLASRNIQNLTLTPPQLLNPYLLLKNKTIIFTQEALEMVNNLWKKPRS